jgi:hypothetical protein
MSFIDDVHTLLSSDEELIALLPGGIYSGKQYREIKRQDPEAAFDSNKKIKPCLLVVENTDIMRGPYRRSMQTTISVYFYQLVGYEVIERAMDRTFDLLHDQKVGANTWSVQFSNAVKNQNDIALDCSLSTQRYVAARMQQVYVPEGS